MQRYFSIENFRQAILFGAVMTLFSSPRIFASAVLPVYYVIPAFALLTLVAAAVTAWGQCEGMKGAFPQGKTMLYGLVPAFILLILLSPLKLFWLNPLFYSALQETGNVGALRLGFPESVTTGIALTLWTMSFETFFFQAAAMSFFAKLTKHIAAALVLSAMLRFFVTWLRIEGIGIESGQVEILSNAVLMNLLSCLLFMRYGLPAPMLFIGGLSIYRWAFLWGRWGAS